MYLSPLVDVISHVMFLCSSNVTNNFSLVVFSGKNQLMATRGLPHTGSATWIGRMKPSLAAGFERRTSNAATPCDSRSR